MKTRTISKIISFHSKIILKNNNISKTKELNDEILNDFISYDFESQKKILIKNPQLINSYQKNSGKSLLFLSIENDLYDLCKFLLKNKANVNYQNIKNFNNTCLHRAIEISDNKTINLLLENNADPNLFNLNKETPLHIAANFNRFKIIKLLKCYNANFYIENKDGLIPLDYAKQKGFEKCIKVLSDVDNNNKNFLSKSNYNFFRNSLINSNKFFGNKSLINKTFNVKNSNNNFNDEKLYEKNKKNYYENEKFDKDNFILISSKEINNIETKSTTEKNPFEKATNYNSSFCEEENNNNNKYLNDNNYYNNFVYKFYDSSEPLKIFHSINNNIFCEFPNKISTYLNYYKDNTSFVNKFNSRLSKIQEEEYNFYLKNSNNFLNNEKEENYDFTFNKSKNRFNSNNVSSKNNRLSKFNLRNSSSKSNNIFSIDINYNNDNFIYNENIQNEEFNYNENEIFLYLKTIEMEQYSKILIENGFDDINFLINQMNGKKFLNNNDLKNIGIIKCGDRAKILIKLEKDLNSKKLKFNENKFNFNKIFYIAKENDIIKDKNLNKLYNYFNELKLKNYFNEFYNNNYHTLELLLIQMLSKNPLTNEILENDLNINKYGHRIKILNKLKEDSNIFYIKYKYNENYNSINNEINFQIIDNHSNCNCIIF